MSETTQPSTTSADSRMLINDQYFTIKKIGQGGFGAVWRAYDFSLRNFVAVKELLPEFSDMKYVEMFYKEALIAKNLIHDNIVRVQHFWKGSNGSFYILMDFVRGSDLEHIIKRCNSLQTRLPWELSILICSSILKALDYASRLAKDTISGKPYGIVYRDISPGNIIVSFEGSVKLSDFGIAKTAEELNGAVKQRVVTGKHAYMSPEQIQGETDIDHRSDIFSVGVVLYEMLTGQRLYEGSNAEIKTQVVEKHFDPSLLANLGLPDELIDVVVKALEKERSLRYEKAIEMFRDLRRLLKGKETEELTIDLSDFIGSIMAAEQDNETRIADYVKRLNLMDIRNDTSVVKVMCRDFIVGSDDNDHPRIMTVETPHAPADSAAAGYAQRVPPPPVSNPFSVPPPSEIPQPAKSAVPNPTFIMPEQPPRVAAAPQRPAAPARPATPPPPASVDRQVTKGEKGKTVFEEVGDWLVTRFKVYRRRLIRVTTALVIALFLFGLIDTFARITPFGRAMFSRLYPPDVIITTVPSGASVTMKTRDDKAVLSNKSSERPIELRGIPPKTYVLTAVKEGFKPVERIVKVEEPDKDAKLKIQQKIEIYFDFTMSIQSTPDGADIYVDGAKFKTTPWQGQFTSGEHTIKLSVPGFEDLGSIAKETKDGQCNIDLTRSTLDEMFAGVDKNYWKYSMSRSNDMTVFVLEGNLVKKVSFNSRPIGMMVQLKGESQPRGQTPLTIPLRAGEYSVRFFDSAGRYDDETRTVLVNKESSNTMAVELKKWVTFTVAAKDNPQHRFTARLKVAGNGLALDREIASGKPLRLALPLGQYRVSFVGDAQFKPLAVGTIDIENRASVAGALEYNNPTLKVSVKNAQDAQPIPDAYVWFNGKMIGKTNSVGLFSETVAFGSATVRLIAKGYLENAQDRYMEPGKAVEMDFRLETEQPVISSGTAVTPRVEAPSRPVVTPPVPSATVPAPSSSSSTDTITCANCGKIYTVGPKKLRFCTNCGKPFR